MGISNEELDMIALRDVSHAELVENNDSYVGQVVKGTGQIVGIEELPLDGLAYLIDTGNDEYYLLYDDQVRHGETGYALFYGTVAGLQTIELESGSTAYAVVLNNEDVIMADAPFN